MSFESPRSPEDYASIYAGALLIKNDANLLAIACAKIKMSKDVYDPVATSTGVPWDLLGALHYREASLNFNRYFQNGDPLFGPDGEPVQTVNDPAGLGPYASWADSALADLKARHLPKTWSIGVCLDFAERFNGRGYWNMGVPSPYIWAGTNIYQGGLFIKDHVYDPNVWDSRLGVAAILKSLQG